MSCSLYFAIIFIDITVILFIFFYYLECFFFFLLCVRNISHKILLKEKIESGWERDRMKEIHPHSCHICHAHAHTLGQVHLLWVRHDLIVTVRGMVLMGKVCVTQIPWLSSVVNTHSHHAWTIEESINLTIDH